MTRQLPPCPRPVALGMFPQMKPTFASGLRIFTLPYGKDSFLVQIFFVALVSRLLQSPLFPPCSSPDPQGSKGPLLMVGCREPPFPSPLFLHTPAPWTIIFLSQCRSVSRIFSFRATPSIGPWKATSFGSLFSFFCGRFSQLEDFLPSLPPSRSLPHIDHTLGQFLSW